MINVYAQQCCFRLCLLACITLVVFVKTAVLAQSPLKEDYAASLAIKLNPDQKVVYKTVKNRRLSLHIFNPARRFSQEKKPAFVAFHGGAWVGGEPRRFYPIVSHMAQNGMVGISAEYRLLNKKDSTTVYECVKDARSVVRYLRRHAEELGIDPNKIIVSGGSAGAHLAAGTALFAGTDEAEENETDCTPNALVLYYPVIDTSPDGYGNKTIGEGWKSLSPLHQVRPGIPPTLIFHGTADTVTPYKGALAFKKAMTKVGNRCILHSHKGGIHGYMMFQQPLYEEAINKTMKFLIALGYVEKERTSEWKPLFSKTLSNAVYPAGVWSVENGVLTATEDRPIWTKATHENFELELEFKNASGTNSGVFVYADTTRWISHSVEVQIADDYDSAWAHRPESWQCGAIFGHQPAVKKAVKPPGEWNHYRILCRRQNVVVYLNGELVNDFRMNQFVSAKTNPDGTTIAPWLSFPPAELPTRGHIGFQGKHAGKPIWFRKIRIRKID